MFVKIFMPKIKKVLSDYEEVLLQHPKYASWPEMVAWDLLKTKKKEGKNAEAAALLLKGLPMVPLVKSPLKEILNHYDCRAKLMLNYFKNFIIPEISDEYLKGAIERTALISEDNIEAIKTLSDSGVEVHIGSTGTPKEVIERHLEMHGIGNYVSSVVGNPMKIDDGIDFKVKYADRKGKYRIMKKIKGKTPYENFAIIDDEPDVTKTALEEVYYNGGLVRIMESRKKYLHPYFEVGSFKEFADLVISQK